MGVTPLVFAVETGDFECILALLAFGADPDIVPNDHRTPVFHAVETENTDALRLLLALKARADVILPENKASALHMAARKGFTPELTQILLEAGANPEHVLGGRFEAGSTALLIAAKHGNFEIVQHLVNFGANLEVPDTTKRTALYMAADKGYKDIVVALCVGGARINTQDRWKTTALHAAVKSKNVDVVEAMVDMGALVHTRNDFSPYASGVLFTQSTSRSMFSVFNVVMCCRVCCAPLHLGITVPQIPKGQLQLSMPSKQSDLTCWSYCSKLMMR